MSLLVMAADRGRLTAYPEVVPVILVHRARQLEALGGNGDPAMRAPELRAPMAVYVLGGRFVFLSAWSSAFISPNWAPCCWVRVREGHATLVHSLGSNS